MNDRLREKTMRYEDLLDEALASVQFDDELDHEERELADDHVEMARAYLDDGRHFQADDDYVTALAAFSYGHGWLDAAVRADLVDANHDASTPEPRDV